MRIPSTFNKTVIVMLVLAVGQPITFADDWPQWRGPNRDGIAPSSASPKSLPERLTLKWKVAVGAGHASPIVAGGRIYLLTRRDGQETISCLNLASGKPLWQNRYATRYVVHQAAIEHGDGPKATPLLQHGRLYTLGITGVMSCLDAASGRLLWRNEPGGGVHVAYPRFGMAISPLLMNGVLIAPVGGDRKTAAIAGFDASNGREKWRWANDRMHPEDGPEYSSPIAVEIGGQQQVVTIGGKKVVGLAPDSGRLLWQFPFEADWESTVTPVFHKGLVIVSGHSIGMFALRVSQCAGQWGAEQAWQNPSLFTFMSTPVANGDLLFGLADRNKGQYFCADVNTGKTLWATTGREAENAAILGAGEVLFFLTNEATLIVARSSAQGFEPLRRYQVADSPTWAHPVVLGKQILIKDASTLALWSME
jgi:outer membrane protein assembly factor BamB